MLVAQLLKSKSNCNELCLVRQCPGRRACQISVDRPRRVQIGQCGAATDTIEQKLIFIGREEGVMAMRQLIQEGGMTPPVIIFVQSRERAAARLKNWSAMV